MCLLRATTACTFSTSQLPKIGPNLACFVHFDFEMCFAPQRRALCRHLSFQKWSEHVRTCCVLYILTSKCASRIFAPQRRALFRHLNFQKWSEPGVLCAFWLRNVLASRHSSVHFFDISTFQNWSEPGLLCAFWLRNVLRATTACNFSSLIWPAGSTPAALARLLFDPPEPQTIGKTQCFATLLPFSRTWIFFLLTLSLSSSLLFSDSSHLCFSSVHIVGNLTSKLPAIICKEIIHINYIPVTWLDLPPYPKYIIVYSKNIPGPYN